MVELSWQDMALRLGLALGLGWLLAVLALLGPSWQRVEQVNLKRADPLVVVLDLSTSMLASDVAPNRLEQAKRKLLDLSKHIYPFLANFSGLIPLQNEFLWLNLGLPDPFYVMTIET